MKKRVHFIAIGGSAMHNLAIALHKKGYMGTIPLEHIDFVLEGGSVESDGKGTILTTSQCLCNPNRNGGLGKTEVERHLKRYLGAKRVLWLDHGYLAGDDTDSHIDTLARFTDESTITYVKCEDRTDEHYHALSLMEEELRTFRQANGEPYRLIPLPMCDARYSASGERLPATYANFLMTNDALLFPTYNDSQNDRKSEETLRALFPEKEMIPINCLKLIEEGGSLHCSTMQVAH
jgi:agmatine deiminase